MTIRRVGVVRRGRSAHYTAGRDTSGRFSRLPVTVTVTAAGHWFRSDDPCNRHNDRVCRGCGASGHFDYILDYQPCARPADGRAVAVALGVDRVEVAA